MTNYIKSIGLVLLLSLILSSCSDFLEENPKTDIFVTNYYKTEQDLVESVNSIYAYLNAMSDFPYGGVYFDPFWTIMGDGSDEMNNNYAALTDYEQISNFNFSVRNGSLYTLWQIQYKTIYVANLAIEHIPDPSIVISDNMRARLMGEAKFLRGLMYFNLVRMFGSVPLVLESDGPIKPFASPVEDIYAQVIEDLQAAENLPSKNEYAVGDGRGRATKYAAKGILAKVYLTLHRYQDASDKANEVIESGDYSLWDNYEDVFKIANRGGKESVFSVGFGDAGGSLIFWEEAGFNVRLLPLQLSQPHYGITENTHGWTVGTRYAYDSYEPGDERRGVTFFDYPIKNANGTLDYTPYIRKYWDSIAEPRGQPSSQDFPLLRYSDIYLMYAEANNELGNTAIAYEYINLVRNRANLTDLQSGLDKDAFRNAILMERMHEFLCEGQRWFDLVRTGTLETMVPLAKPGVNPKPENYLFPIPQAERDVNPNLPQNTGY
jgi:starch-binding outer membrane protein, SusD/RagB family